MRKLISLVLVLMLAVSCVSFASADAAAENALTISIGLNPNLDTQWNAGSDGALLLMQMYEGLYRYTGTGFELAGATEVNVSEDGLTWTFKLREDAVWNDGKAVTANDYVYSLKRLVDPAIGTIYMKDYGQFMKNGLAIANGEMAVDELGVKAIDDYTLEIQLQDVCTFFDAILCYSTFYPLRSDVVVEDGNGNWAWEVERSITNGAMNMVACDEEQEIVLEKNPTYWNAESIGLDKLTVKLVEDDNTRLSLYRTGELDMLFAYPSEETASLREDGSYHSTPALSTNFLLLNTNKEPLNNPLVRRALSLSIDRDYLSNVLLNGIKTPAVSYVGAGFPGATDDADFRTDGGNLIATDTDTARQLLAEAGYPDGEGFPIIECSYTNASADYTIVFEYLQAIWEEELGITVTLAPMENAAMGELRDAGKFDITPQAWGADYLDVSNMLSIFVTGNFINAGRYSSEEFDSLYTESLSTMDRATRMGLLQQAEKILVVDDAGMIPIYHGNAVAIYSDNVCSNVKYTSNGKVVLTDVVVTK